MARTSSWKGYLRISLVTFPVKAYTAGTSGDSHITLNQLHASCHSRIQYKKTCPVHGVVSNDEIVSGFEYSNGQYVVIDPDELERLRSNKDHNVNVMTFVKADTIDPLYHSGKAYYLIPDGPIGQKPYQLVHQAMSAEKVDGIAQVVISRKEELVLVRPVEQLLVMTVLKYATEVKESAAFADELVATKGTKQEQELTKQLIGALTSKRFELRAYHDAYTDRLTQLIEAKVQGREIVSPPAGEEPDVINLMDAIKASMKQIRPSEERRKPPRKATASKTSRSSKTPSAPRRRKSG